MRLFIIVCWSLCIFLGTCTSSFHGFIETGLLRFQWTSSPVLSELMSPLPEEMSQGFLQQKIGHVIAFFILTVLLLTRFLSSRLIFVSAGIYAALTEFLQLYFNRGGRLFDIGFDLIGILLALGVGSLFAGDGRKTGVHSKPKPEVGRELQIPSESKYFTVKQ